MLVRCSFFLFSHPIYYYCCYYPPPSPPPSHQQLKSGVTWRALLLPPTTYGSCLDFYRGSPTFPSLVDQRRCLQTHAININIVVPRTSIIVVDTSALILARHESMTVALRTPRRSINRSSTYLIPGTGYTTIPSGAPAIVRSIVIEY